MPNYDEEKITACTTGTTMHTDERKARPPTDGLTEYERDAGMTLTDVSAVAERLSHVFDRPLPVLAGIRAAAYRHASRLNWPRLPERGGAFCMAPGSESWCVGLATRNDADVLALMARLDDLANGRIREPVDPSTLRLSNDELNRYAKLATGQLPMF